MSKPMPAEFIHTGGFARVHIQLESDSPILEAIARMLGYDSIKFIDYVDDAEMITDLEEARHMMVPWIEPVTPLVPMINKRRAIRDGYPVIEAAAIPASECHG